MGPRGVPWTSRGVPWPLYEDHSLEDPYYIYSCLSVTLLYCGQTVGWIKMKRGMQVGLGPGDFVLDGDPAVPSSRRGGAPNFWPISIVAKRLYVLGYHLVQR